MPHSAKQSAMLSFAVSAAPCICYISGHVQGSVTLTDTTLVDTLEASAESSGTGQLHISVCRPLYDFS